MSPSGQRVADQGWSAVVAAYERAARHLERPPAEHLASSRELREAVRQALAETRRKPGSVPRSQD